MKQNIPKVPKELLTSGAKSARGLHEFGDDAGVKQNGEVAVQADCDALAKADNECQTAKTAKLEAVAQVAAMDLEVSSFISLTRELLKPTFGPRYSVKWNEVGFVNNSLALPGSMDGRIGQVKVIELFLDAHPELVKPGVLTAGIATTLHDNALAALNAQGIALTTLRQKVAARDQASLAMQRRLRGLFQELKRLLPANDPRWLEFGFNVPGDVSVPAAPTGLAVTPGLPGNLSASWQKPKYAVRFRVFRKVVGQDEEFAALDTTKETSLGLSGLTSGTHVQFYVTAVNAAGESVPSETVEVVVP